MMSPPPWRRSVATDARSHGGLTDRAKKNERATLGCGVEISSQVVHHGGVQERLREPPPSAEVVDLNAERLARGLRAVESAREWLRRETQATPAAVCAGTLAEAYAAHYAFALGQLDRALSDSLEGRVAPNGHGSLARVRVLRRCVSELLAYCDRRAREPLPSGEGARGQLCAIRRARAELTPILGLALK